VRERDEGRENQFLMEFYYHRRQDENKQRKNDNFITAKHNIETECNFQAQIIGQ
jgi:hypothetical protein